MATYRWTPNNNIAIGYKAGKSTSGEHNVAIGCEDRSLYDAFYGSEIHENMDLTDSFLNLDETFEKMDNTFDDFHDKLEKWMKQFDEDAEPIRRPSSTERTVHPHSKESITDRLKSEFKVDPRIEELEMDKKKLKKKVTQLESENEILEIKVLRLKRERDELAEMLGNYQKREKKAEKTKKVTEPVKGFVAKILEWWNE